MLWEIMVADLAKPRVRPDVVRYMAFVALSNFSLLNSYLSLFLAHLGVSVASVSLLFMVYQVCKLVFEIPTGFISDFFGRRQSGRIGLVGLAFSLALLLLPFGFAGLVVSFVVKGIAYTCISGSFEAIFVETIPSDELAHYNTIERVVWYSSSAVSTVVGGLAISAGLYWQVAVVDIVVTILTLAVTWNTAEPSEAPADEAVASSVAACWKEITGNATLLLFLLMDLSIAVAFVGVEDYYSMFLTGLGFDESLAGLFISSELIFSALIGLAISRAREGKGGNKLRLIILGPAAKIAATALMFAPGLPPICAPVLYLAQDIVYAVYAPIKYAAFQLEIPSRFRSTVLSVQSQAVSLGSIVFFGASASFLSGFELREQLLCALLVSFAVTFTASCVVVRRLMRSRQAERN